MKRQNPDTSISAYKSLKASEVQQTYKDILRALDSLGKGTFEDIAAFLKCSRDKIWKRLSEMEKLEMIYKPGTKKVLKSGRSGYEWMRTKPENELQSFMDEFQNEPPPTRFIQSKFF